MGTKKSKASAPRRTAIVKRGGPPIRHRGRKTRCEICRRVVRSGLEKSHCAKKEVNR